MTREPRHSVLMITYNQDKYISTSLDSVLTQEPMPYEIIISDDASTDDTWNIIEAYKKKYPSIIKAKRTNENLGIYGNLNSILKTATGDIVSVLAGDDFYKPNLFKEFNRVISENNVDLDMDDFIIVANFEFLFPNGSSVLYNNYQLKGKNIFKQRIRYGFFNREIGISRNIIDKIDYARTDIGVHADWVYGLDIDSKCKDYYFTPIISSVYRAGIGTVSKEISKKMYTSRIDAIRVIKSKFKDYLDENDISFLDYELCLNNYFINDTFHDYFKLWIAYMSNLTNFPINNSAFNLKRLLTLLPPKIRMIIKKYRKMKQGEVS